MYSSFFIYLCAAVSGMILFISLFLVLNEPDCVKHSYPALFSQSSRVLFPAAVSILFIAVSLVLELVPMMCLIPASAMLLSSGHILYRSYRQSIVRQKRLPFLTESLFWYSLLFFCMLMMFLAFVPCAVRHVDAAWLRGVLVLMDFILVMSLFIMFARGRNAMFLIPVNMVRKMEETLMRSNDPKFVCNQESDGISSEIMERMMNYLLKDNEYLNPDLLASDVAKQIYTNRVYLSRAIKGSGNVNFSRMVNTMRVEYSVKLFDKNPNLTVNKLASASGFKTTPTYSAAFRMVMGESPTEWCKYRRAYLQQQRKSKSEEPVGQM